MREFSKDLKSTVLFPNSDKKRCKTVNGKRKCSQSATASEQVVIGKYKYFTDSLLGEGYSSKVYKGTEVDKPQKRYAIKVIELQKFEGDTLKMLEEEINIHLKLKHENVVECYDAIKQKNNYFLILEFCPHGSLEEFIQRKKKIGLISACQIMDQIATGYRYLVANNIVHRDIKPANILKVENRWKLADFGFAVRKCVSFTSHMNVGTPLYMPPEALLRSQYSFKSDIFALGVTFYQMTHGDTPWPCRTQEELLQKIKKQPLVISSHINNQEIRTFIRKACALEYKERMSHQELDELQFLNFVSQSPNAFKQKIVFRALSPRKNVLKTDSSLKTLDLNRSPTKDMIKESSVSENDLLTEVTVCKHIYSMISNIESFLLDQSTKQFFWMALFKFLVRYVHETEKKSEIIKTTCGKKLYNEIKELALRYQKEYLDYLKHLEVKVIRQVNTKFPELCLKSPFCKNFYLKIKSYFVTVMKQVDRQLMETLKTKPKPEDYKDKVEAFRALKKLYEFCHENTLSENSSCKKNLQVCPNYKAVARSNEAEYLTLRKVLISV